MLLTSATIRQSCRSFASAPGLAVLAERRRRAGRDRLAVEAPEPAGAAAAREHHVEDEDHEADDAEPPAAGEDGAAHAAAATRVGDLGGVELGAASEPHRDPPTPELALSRQACLASTGLSHFRSLLVIGCGALVAIAQSAERRRPGPSRLHPRRRRRAHRPAAHGRDAGDATVARAPRSHPPRRDRRDHPLRRQHHEPVPAPSADGRAAERRPGRGSAAAPDRDRPGGRTRPPRSRGPDRSRARRELGESSAARHPA